MIRQDDTPRTDEVFRAKAYRQEREPSIGTLFRDLADEARTLVRHEIDLAKAEVGEKASRASRNIAYLAIGGLIAYAGLIALIGAACVGLAVLLSKGMNPSAAAWLGPLIVGVVVGLVGYVLVLKGIAALRRESIVPHKTISALRENKEWLQDRITTSANRMT